MEILGLSTRLLHKTHERILLEIPAFVKIRKTRFFGRIAQPFFKTGHYSRL
jgi:hypothetical protein